MAVAKVAAGHGGTTKAGCSLALLLFASVAGAQTTTPEAPPAAAESPARPAVPPKITYVGGQLRIDALGSTLAEVLTQVAILTGAKIDVPAGAASERMPVVELGPGPARQILAELLSDSNFDYLIQASDADPEKLQAVLLMPREKKTDAPARASRGPYVAAAAPPEAPVPDSPAPAPPEIPAPDASSLTQPEPAQPEQATPPIPAPPDLSGQPLLQPDTSNPAKPGALTPPATLTPQSISQQLQQMYQQRAQMTQQDHYTGTQPVLLPGAK